MSYILIIVFITMAVSLYVSFQTAASPRNNVILNTTLPLDAQKDSRVREIVRQFKKTNLLVFLAALALTPIIFLFHKPSFMLLYLCAWFVSALLSHNWVLAVNSRKMATLKQKNQWFVGNTHTVTVDLEVSRAKSKMAISRWWFLPSLIAATAILVAGIISKELAVYPGIIAVTGIIANFLMYLLTTRQRARAHSEDTEINLAITKTSIRLLTLCWTGLAALNSTGMAVLLFSTHALNTTVLVIVVGVLTFISLAAIILTYNKIRNSQNYLLERAQSPICVDEDYYWRGGFYNNPNDNRTLVEKRIGYGQTVNLATKKGKFAYYGLLIGLPALLLTMFLMFLSMDTANFELTINDNMVEIDAPMYGYQFPVNDIKSVTTIDTLPGGSRTNGAGTSAYNLGNFSLKGYGRSKMYVYKDQPSFIVIELPDLYVFYNAKTPEQTQEIYELLLESLGN